MEASGTLTTVLPGTGAALNSEYETVLDVACRIADGDTTTAQVTASVWSEFTDRSVRRKKMDGFNEVDDHPMGYWVQGGPGGCFLLSDMLSQVLPQGSGVANGTCSAWAELLLACWGVHGVSSADAKIVVTENVVTYLYCNGSLFTFLVPNWANSSPNSSGLVINVALTDQPGVPGQSESDPQSAFLNHAIVAYQQQFYDPSYGEGPFTASGSPAPLVLCGVTVPNVYLSGGALPQQSHELFSLAFLQTHPMGLYSAPRSNQADLVYRIP